jgi:GH15 family glucan-1,4-alpha-glucosidase
MGFQESNMKRHMPVCAAVLAAALLPAARAQAEPHASWSRFPVSNGFSPAVYNSETHRIDTFSDHLYRDYDGTAPSTDLCWDTYWGLNVDGEAAWLGELPESDIAYEPGTGILRVTRTFRDLQVEEYYLSPFGYEGSMLVMVASVTNRGSSPVQASLYALHNFHAGPGAPEAGFGSESITWDSGRFRETGSATGHTFLYLPLRLPAHRRADFAASPGNPYLHISDPALADSDGTGGPGDDAVAAFQWYLGTGGFFDPGETQWEGVVIAYGRNPDATFSDNVVLWIDGRSADDILADAQADWQAWLSAPGVIESEITGGRWLSQARQSLVMLRMGQVREPNGSYGAPHGQIVASMPPGMWNITWPRDQAYAAAGLAEAGFYDEARAAIEFVLNGRAGTYEAEVGSSDYLVSVCRYHGGGFEESDGDPASDGPNIEFDNFGLFLWSLEKYVRESGDRDIVASNADAVFNRTADVLAALIEPSTGLLAADSSIWERHWNGNQKHFAYSNIMAVRGLCSAAAMALDQGLSTEARRAMEAARTLHGGIAGNLVVDSGTFIAQSLEEIAGGSYVDAAVVEALNFELFTSDDPVYDGVLARLREDLWIEATGRGYRRNDDGDWYDEQEWVVMDLRIAQASRMGGDAAHFNALVDWVTNQSAENLGLIAELYDSGAADYEGAVPMMGFGGGAFLLAMLTRTGEESVQECLEGPLPVEEDMEPLPDDSIDPAEAPDSQDDDSVPDGIDAATDPAADEAHPDAVDTGNGDGGGEGCGCFVAQ